MAKQDDLIVARATPDSVSAIAVVRLSGRGASDAVEQIMGLETGRLRGMRRKVGDFCGIDTLVALSWPAGKSYTGEEMVDLMCHGTPGTAESVLGKLLDSGARHADPGEFTRRAWLNGRLSSMDVLELSARFRNITTGDTGRLQEKLFELITEVEALIEFGEEHETADENRMMFLLREAGKAADELRSAAERIEIKPRVFIMGPVNSGKSTLFNLLCKETAAVVSPRPGTTRDGAERMVSIKGKTVNLADTAGTGGDILDEEALEIAKARLRSGDRLIWMDKEQNEPPDYLNTHYSILRTASQRDTEKTPLKKGWIALSSFTGEGVDSVKKYITAAEGGSPSWIYRRAGELINEAEDACRSFDIALAAEIVSGVLEEINAGMKRGEAVERALEVFCVGK